jgi:hypothetical protein
MSKTVIVIVVAIVVIVAVVLVGLFAAHVGPFSTSGSGGSGGSAGESYSQAASAAQATTSSVSGGPWTVAGGVGVDVSTAVTVNQTELNSTASGTGCQSHLLSGASAITTIPASSASASSGLSNAWIVLFSNGTLGVLEVAVFGGSATPLLTEGNYGGCSAGIGSLSLPTGYLDSPAAATVAYNDGGSAYAAAHSAYSLEEILVPTVGVDLGGNTTVISSSWEITYTDCDLITEDGSTLGGQLPAQFTASINATTGLLSSALNATTACPIAHYGGSGGNHNPKPTLSNVTDLIAFSQEHYMGTYWNNGTFITSLTNLTSGDLTVAIENNTTSAPISTSGFTLQITYGAGGPVNASYDFTTNTWNDTSVPVGSFSSSDIWSLITPMKMAGYKIVLIATPSAPVTGSISDALGSH